MVGSPSIATRVVSMYLLWFLQGTLAGTDIMVILCNNDNGGALDGALDDNEEEYEDEDDDDDEEEDDDDDDDDHYRGCGMLTYLGVLREH